MRCPNCASLDTQVKEAGRRRTPSSSGAGASASPAISASRRSSACSCASSPSSSATAAACRSTATSCCVGADRGAQAPVEPERIDQAVSKMVRELESQGESDVSSEAVGELVMEACARSTTSPMCASRRSTAISARPRTSSSCSANCRARTSGSRGRDGSSRAVAPQQLTRRGHLRVFTAAATASATNNTSPASCASANGSSVSVGASGFSAGMRRNASPMVKTTRT